MSLTDVSTPSETHWKVPLGSTTSRGSRATANAYFDLDTNLIAAEPIAKQRARVFAEHEKRWKAETAFLSDPTEKYLNDNYARIIGMGPSAVALILQSMMHSRADWFYALRALTGANPVTDDMAGDMQAMTRAWIDWGHANGFV